MSVQTADILAALDALARRTPKKAQIRDLLPGIQRAREAKVSWGQIALTLRDHGVEISGEVLRKYFHACRTVAGTGMEAERSRNGGGTHPERNSTGMGPESPRNGAGTEAKRTRNGTTPEQDRNHPGTELERKGHDPDEPAVANLGAAAPSAEPSGPEGFVFRPRPKGLSLEERIRQAAHGETASGGTMPTPFATARPDFFKGDKS